MFLVDEAGPQNQGFAHRCKGWIEGWAIAIGGEPETLAEVAVGLIVPMVVPEAIHLGQERVSVANARAVWSCTESDDLIPRFRG